MGQDASIEHVQSASRPDTSATSAIDAALASRAFWKEVCETVGDMIFETDRAGRFVLLMPAGILGYQVHTLIGHLGSDLICDWDGAGGTRFNPFRCQRPTRMQHVWLRKLDGSAVLFAFSTRPTSQGGVRGVGIDVTDDDATVRTSVESVLFQAMLDRIVARMRDEVLTSRIVRAGLDELVGCIGAQGAAVALDAAHAQERATPAPLYATGEGWDEIAPHLATSGVADAATEEAPRSVLSGGRQILVVPNRTRFGPQTAVVAWRRSRSDWRQTERQLVAAVAAALRSTIEQDSLQRQITDHARTDILTGLMSHRCFVEETRRRFDRLDRNAEPGTVLSLDIDHFGALNERHGPECGDEALRQMAAMLRDTFRPTDLVCRIAGDAFAVWLDGADMFAAAERAEWLCRNGMTLLHEGVACRLGVSIGLACRPPHSLEDLDCLLRRADAAMRQAKRQRGVWHASQQEIET